MTTGTPIMGSRSSSRRSLHFLSHFLREFCFSKSFSSFPYQLPRFLPISSNFSDSAIYFLLSNDFVSQRSIKNILIEILQKHISDQKIVNLLKEITYSFKLGGLPLGNLTSQLFANVYLNEFDQFFKHKLKSKY